MWNQWVLQCSEISLLDFFREMLILIYFNIFLQQFSPVQLNFKTFLFYIFLFMKGKSLTFSLNILF